VLDHFGVELLEEVHPTGAAAGEERQVFVLLNAGEEFRGFLDDREIGAVVGVEDFIETHAAQGGHELAGDRRAHGKAKGFTQGGADGGSHLHDHMLDVAGHGQGFPDTLGVILLQEGGGGAHGHALTALDADRVIHVGEVGGAHHGVETTAVLAEVAHALHFGADAHATTTENALFGGADYALARILHGEALALAVEDALADAQAVGLLLQFAVAIALAGLAIPWVVIEQQFDDVTAGLADLGAVGLDFHAFPHFLRTGGEEMVEALDLGHADPAGTLDAEVGVVAETGDVDPELLRRLEDGGSRRNLEWVAVDGEVDHLVDHRVIPRLVLRWVRVTHAQRHRSGKLRSTDRTSRSGPDR